MLRNIIHPKTQSGRFFYMSLIAYLVMGISGCTSMPRTDKPATSIARAMETRSFPGDLKSVLKAAINSLQDMDYTIEVLNSDIGLITASRTTEHAKAGLANEKPEAELSAGQKACLAIGAVAVAGIATAISGGLFAPAIPWMLAGGTASGALWGSSASRNEIEARENILSECMTDRGYRVYSGN